MPSKRDAEKKKKDQRDYHRRMRGMNEAHRMAHKIAGPFERIENYLEEVQGDDAAPPWKDSEEIAAALEAAVLAVGKAIEVLRSMPLNYVAREVKPRAKLVIAVGTVVAVRAKFREDYGVVFDEDELDRLAVVSIKGARIFVRADEDESGKPIPMRRGEVRIVEGGVPE